MRREAIRGCRRAATASEQKIMYTKSKGALYSLQRALYSSKRALYSSKRALLSYATGGGCRLFARVKKQWLQAGKQLCNRKTKEPYIDSKELYFLAEELYFDMPLEACEGYSRVSKSSDCKRAGSCVKEKQTSPILTQKNSVF